MLAVITFTERRSHMNQIAVARERLEQATGLPAILSAAYDAFEDMLPVIEELQDPGGGAFAAFVMSGASAASGRDAVAAAPSLPSISSADANRRASSPMPADAGTWDPARVLAEVSSLLARRLADVGASAADPGDQAACAQAARHAADICSLLRGAPRR
jgi:hypothetical protein